MHRLSNIDSERMIDKLLGGEASDPDQAAKIEPLRRHLSLFFADRPHSSFAKEAVLQWIRPSHGKGKKERRGERGVDLFMFHTNYDLYCYLYTATLF